MKNLLLVVIIFVSCTSQPKNLSEESTLEIIAADKAMSDMAIQEGFNKTLLQYADDGVVKFQDGESPVIGNLALEKYWSGKTDTKNISWEPFKAEASSSGDMGYSLGNWKMTTPDTTYYGNYYTIWKRQTDGTWKFVVDGGNNTPAPMK